MHFVNLDPLHIAALISVPIQSFVLVVAESQDCAVEEEEGKVVILAWLPRRTLVPLMLLNRLQ